MSAPDTNLNRQKRRHWGPLAGLALAVLVAGGLLFGFLVYTADTDTPTAVSPAPETQLPAGGVPARPLNDPTAPPQVIEPDPAPAD